MPDLIIKADVQILDVENMFHRLDNALEGRSLGAFLQGPVRRYYGRQIAQRFASEGDKKSGDWDELSDATVELRQRMGFTPDVINVRTSELFRFATQSSDLRVGMGFAELDIPGEAENSELAKKLETAQFGRAQNPIPTFGPTPPRPVIATDEEDLAEIVLRLGIHITEFMTGAAYVP